MKVIDVKLPPDSAIHVTPLFCATDVCPELLALFALRLHTSLYIIITVNFMTATT